MGFILGFHWKYVWVYINRVYDDEVIILITQMFSKTIKFNRDFGICIYIYKFGMEKLPKTTRRTFTQRNEWMNKSKASKDCYQILCAVCLDYIVFDVLFQQNLIESMLWYIYSCYTSTHGRTESRNDQNDLLMTCISLLNHNSRLLSARNNNMNKNH